MDTARCHFPPTNREEWGVWQVQGGVGCWGRGGYSDLEVDGKGLVEWSHRGSKA